MPTRRMVLGLVAASTTLAGCTGDGGGGASPTGTPTSSPSPTSSPTATAEPTPTETATRSPTEGMDGPTVQVATHPALGEILVGPEGLTLYMFDADTQGSGSSACSDGCADAWPPLTVTGEPSSGDGVAATLSTFERASGGTQVTANGWPLYYFRSDAEPDDANGQGVNDAWWVLRPDGTPVRAAGTETPTPEPSPTVQVASHPEYGDILVDAEGVTLYMFDRDTRGEGASACSGGCADAWPPLTVTGDPSSGEAVTATLSTFERDSGARQVAANGWPLYRFSSDEGPGDARGQGVNDAWWVLRPDGTPVREMRTGTPTPTDGMDTATPTPTPEPTPAPY